MREREPITGVWGGAPSGVHGAEPPVGGQGRKLPEADGISVLEHTFLRSPEGFFNTIVSYRNTF